VLDEPTSSLDITIRGEIVELLRKLKRDLDLIYLMTSPDLTTAAAMSDRVAVLYLKQIIEMTTATPVFQVPAHPYQIGLLASPPIADLTAPRPAIRLPARSRPPSCQPAAP
jgi:ABC-type dipeptide/oligopeptide/nickel transport system ATPase component